MRCARSLAGALMVVLGLYGCGPDESVSENLQHTSSPNHSWGSYHWARTSNPFTVLLGDNVSSDWDFNLETASSDWSKSTVLDTTIVTGGSSNRNCRRTNGRVEVCNAKYGFNGWLGVATIWISGDHITAGTVKVNDSYFNTATYNTIPWRQLVMCQEIGHTFGLDHQDENFNNANLGTCMDYTNDPSTNQHPNQHDYDQLVTIYGHLDSTTTLGSLVASANLPPQASDAADGAADPAAWGKLIRRSADGRYELYELDLGNGNRIRTFVIRA